MQFAAAQDIYLLSFSHIGYPFREYRFALRRCPLRRIFACLLGCRYACRRNLLIALVFRLSNRKYFSDAVCNVCGGKKPNIWRQTEHPPVRCLRGRRHGSPAGIRYRGRLFAGAMSRKKLSSNAHCARSLRTAHEYFCKQPYNTHPCIRCSGIDSSPPS